MIKNLIVMAGLLGLLTASCNDSTTALFATNYITAGYLHACARNGSGAVKCWGSSGDGQIGQGETSNHGDGAGEMGDNLPVIDLGTGRTALALAAGVYHVCALLDQGAVKCWGYNFTGLLGQGDTANRGDDPNEMGDNLPAIDLGTGRTAQLVVSGWYFVCARLDNNAAKCWGDNSFGELGQGDTASRGDNPNEMGDNLPAIDLGVGRTAVALAGGRDHACALLDDGTVKCWGSNNAGQLGQGDTTNRGDNANEMGDNLPAIPLGAGRTAVAIAAGRDHSCALLDNGTVKCWGDNSSGELGQGDTANRGDNANEMGDNLLVIDLGAGRTAVDIKTGWYHTCALLDDSTVKCWGNNANGQLGQGDTAYRGDNANEMGDNLLAIDLGAGRTATAIATGLNHTCALLDDSTVKCWGYNSNGQLGQGDAADRGDNANEMGDNLPPIDLGTF
jgi:alpha-tubulin suppressor-like RCC1 family protein